MKKLCQCGKKISRKEVCSCKASQVSPSYEQKQSAYNNRMWKAYSILFRTSFPLCAHCERKGKVTSIHPDDAPRGGCVDHIMPFKDKSDPLFNDPLNHQGLCSPCHTKKTQLETAGKYTQEMIDQDLKDRYTSYHGNITRMNK